VPTGPGDVLALIRHGVAGTRGEVLHATGLSRMTVSDRIGALLTAGLVVEGEDGPATGGRRPRSLRFNTGHARVLTAAVHTTHTRVAVCDLDGRLLRDEDVDVAVVSGPERTLDAVAAAASRLLDALADDLAAVCGLGVSVPGPVDPATGRPSSPPMMPGWDGHPVAEHLAAALGGLPVLVADDADAAALGEHRAGHRDARALCLVEVSTGIGCGIVLDGRPYVGTDGGAGDLGHVRLREHAGARCQCGGTGCLAAVASGHAVAQELTALGVPAGSGRDVRRLLAAGSPEAGRLVQDAGRLVGEVLATVVSVLNPDVVVIGGALASAPLIAGVRETLYSRSLPRATRHMTLQLGRLGDDAALVGLTHLVVDERFSAAAVNARLGG
jgi:predicted NBD/HSP70 family sugar kinase